MQNRVVLASPFLIAILLIGTISSSVNFASAGMESSSTGITTSGLANSAMSALPGLPTQIPAMPDILKLPAMPSLQKTQNTVGPLVTITAAKSGNWNNGTTWVGGIVPGITDNKIIPFGINVTVTTEVDNNGTITNSGTITVANSDSNSIGIFCRDSGSAITNNSGGQIIVLNTGTTSDGIVSYGTLTNSGTIKILNSGTNSYGIQNSKTLTNSGTITISNSGYIGILNVAPISNSGTITILNSINPSFGIVNYIIGTITNNSGGQITVANSGLGSQGIYNFVTITNNSGGKIIVTSSGDSGITNGDGSTLTNSGTITISSSGPYGIYNQHTLTNNSGGQVIVSNTAASSYGIVNNNGNTTNSGTITVQNTGTSSTGISNSGNFTNTGTMGISGNFTNVAGATLVNMGTLGLNHGDTITFTGPSTYSGSFANNGKFTMKPKSFVTLGSGTQLTIISGTLINPSGVTLSILSKSSLNVNLGTKLLNSGVVTFQGKINNSGGITNISMIKKLCGGIFSGNPVTGNPITNVCNPTVTLVTPNPSTVTHAMMITFTATVIDTSATPVVPTGKVSWNDGGAGGHFGSVTCTLVATSPSQSHCSLTYKAPLTTGMDTITGAYSGDSSHVKSVGTSKLTVT